MTRRIALLAVVVLLAVSSGFAEALRWVPADGPWGGTMRAVVADPARVSTWYALHEEGLAVSVDGGASWKELEPPFLTRASSIVVTASGEVVVGTAAGLFISENGGTSWTRRYEGEVGAVVEGRDGTLYVAFDSLLMSRDHWTWQVIPSSFSDGFLIDVLAVDPVNAEALYAAGSFGFRMSLNGGAAWSEPAGLPYARVEGIAADDSFVYVAYVSQGLYRVNRDGTGAVRLSTPAGGYSTGITLDTVRKRIWLTQLSSAPIFSDDGGVSWTAVADPRAFDTMRVTVTGKGTTLLATRAAGVIVSTDGASTWSEANEGIRGLHVYAIRFAPDGSLWTGTDHGFSRRSGSEWRTVFRGGSGLDVVFGGAGRAWVGTGGGGAWRSDDGAATWRALPLHGFTVPDLEVDPSDGSTLFAATLAGIFRSSDGGDSWVRLQNGLKASVGRSVAVDPADRRIVYAFAGAGSFEEYEEIGAHALFLSTDGGDSWRVTPGPPVAFILPGTPSIAYGGSDGVYRSTSGTSDWTSISEGIPPGVSVMKLAWSPVSGVLYALVSKNDGERAQLLARTPGAPAWELIGSAPMFDVRDLAVSPEGELLLGGQGGLWKAAPAGRLRPARR